MLELHLQNFLHLPLKSVIYFFELVICFLIGIFLVDVSTHQLKLNSRETVAAVEQSTTLIAPPPEIEDEPIDEYPGVTIDQVFPIISDRSLAQREKRDRTLTPVSGFQVETHGFGPVAVLQNSHVILKLRTRSPRDEYWTNLIGTSQLLGANSNQIYIVTNGPGAVCCTNYWIIDVKGKTPRIIFRSEEYGWLRDPMEVFDSDHDGVYELVQFDSCFRYFMDDCGACSPEPRVMFKYDTRAQRYLPVTGVMQDFARADLTNEEKKVKQWVTALKRRGDAGDELELSQIAMAAFVQRLHIGDEAGAWRIFRRAFPKPSKKLLEEIRNRLDNCPYYQALRHGNIWKP